MKLLYTREEQTHYCVGFEYSHLILEISPINLKWNAGVRIPLPPNSLPTPLENHQELLLHRQILILQTQSSEWHPTGLVSVQELTPVKFVWIGKHERRSTVQRVLAWKSNVSFSRDCLRRAMTKGHVNTMCYCVLKYTARIKIQKEESKLTRFVCANRLQSIAHFPSTPTSNDGPRRHSARERERERERERGQQTTSETALSRARYERALHPRDPTNHRVRLDWTIPPTFQISADLDLGQSEPLDLCSGARSTRRQIRVCSNVCATRRQGALKRERESRGGKRKRLFLWCVFVSSLFGVFGGVWDTELVSRCSRERLWRCWRFWFRIWNKNRQNWWSGVGELVVVVGEVGRSRRPWRGRR